MYGKKIALKGLNGIPLIIINHSSERQHTTAVSYLTENGIRYRRSVVTTMKTMSSSDNYVNTRSCIVIFSELMDIFP